MTVTEIIDSLAQQGIQLWVEGENLRFRAQKGALTPELRTLLTENKPALVAYLREQSRQAVEYFPLSYNQQSMWFMNQSAPESAAYNVAFTVRVRSHVDVDALRRAFQAIADRHPTLRTIYAFREGAPMQATQGSSEVAFEVVDAASMNDDALNAAVVAAYERPFDLENGPVFRVSLFTRAAEDHVLMIAVHHIALDGWSMWLLLDDLRALYPAYLNQQPAALPSLDAAYIDFMKWQTALLNGAEGERLAQYWQTRLAGELPVLDVPTDHPRPPTPSFRGATHIFVIEADLTHRLRDLAKAEGVTLYALLLAAFQTLLYRYSGQDDIIIGSPMFGRNRPEFARIIGDFVNMVALRASLTGDMPFAAFLAQTRQTVLEAIDHQEYPFPLLVQKLGSSRDSSRSAVFQAVFDLQRVQQAGAFADLFIPGKRDIRLELGGLQIEPFPMPQQEGQFDLVMQIAEAGDVLPGTLKYSTDVFDSATIERLMRHFTTLLGGIVANPQQALAQLPLLDADERRAMVTDWNRTQVEYAHERRVTHFFEERAASTPAATAVICDGASLSYAELNQRANQLAHYLRAQGVGPDVLVGVCMERSLDMMVALFGVLKAGGAYVPMDPEYPRERLGYMVEDARMPIILTQQRLLDHLPDHQSQVIRIDADWNTVAAQPAENPVVRTEGDDLAYVIFTSGSTGRPKGVQISHRALINFLLSMQREPGLSAADVLVSVTTLSFDIAGLELYLPLITGATVVIASRDTVIDGTALAALLDETNATVMQATPATWRLMIESGWQGRAGLKMLCGGEGLPRKLMEQLLERGAELWNMYGPTETTIWSTVCRLFPNDPIISIGKPIANTQVYVLDEHLALVPVGAVGALYIGGDGLARGYLGRPDLTDERFIPNPFDPALGRIYNTGDQARWLSDGRLECLGRVDHQVKIRGFRIELGEIETAIGKHPAVQIGVVVAREVRPGDKRLIAYVAPKAGQSLDAGDLRHYLRDRLPEYMLPSSVVMLETMPLTPNGKVDRKALPPPPETRSEQTLVLPQTPTEQLMAGIWSEALSVAQISTHDNFFDLGGHSLLAMQVIGKIADRTGLRLEPAIMRFQTLGQLAAMVDEELAKGVDAPPTQTDQPGAARRLFKIVRRAVSS
ncbi:MAG: amino acid adenylation domain-containing protein [Anaerolineae bacterium]|nr:amino acid adenylation domain-containing protein [Anaerolineae bacterium]